MDLEKVLENAASDANLTETYAVKMSVEMKEQFFEVCQKRGLSTGKVVREMIRQFIESIEGE